MASRRSISNSWIPIWFSLCHSGTYQMLTRSYFYHLQTEFKFVKLHSQVIKRLNGLLFNYSQGGQQMLNLVDFYGTSFIVFILTIGEIVAVCWVYGSYWNPTSVAVRVFNSCSFSRCWPFMPWHWIHDKYQTWLILAPLLGHFHPALDDCHSYLHICIIHSAHL